MREPPTHRFHSKSHVSDPDFLRTDDRRSAFTTALAVLQKNRNLTRDLLEPLGLTEHDYRRVKLQHGKALQRAMTGLLEYLLTVELRPLFRLHDFGFLGGDLHHEIQRTWGQDLIAGLARR